MTIVSTPHRDGKGLVKTNNNFLTKSSQDWVQLKFHNETTDSLFQDPMTNMFISHYWWEVFGDVLIKKYCKSSSFTSKSTEMNILSGVLVTNSFSNYQLNDKGTFEYLN